MVLGAFFSAFVVSPLVKKFERWKQEKKLRKQEALLKFLTQMKHNPHECYLYTLESMVKVAFRGVSAMVFLSLGIAGSSYQTFEAVISPEQPPEQQVLIYYIIIVVVVVGGFLAMYAFMGKAEDLRVFLYRIRNWPDYQKSLTGRIEKLRKQS